MIHLAYKKEQLALVQVATGSFDEASIEPLLGLADQFQRDANGSNRMAYWLTIIDDQAEPPGALARKRLASTTIPFQNLRCAVVTSSALHRAILVALRWLAPAKPGQLFAEFGRFQEATRWMEQQAREPMPFWEELLHEAQPVAGPSKRAASWR